MSDEPRWGQLGIALDEVERRGPVRSDRAKESRLAGPWRALEQDVRTRVEGRNQQLDLAGTVEDRAGP